MVWAKGQSGNPQGRKPNETTFAPLLRRLLAEKTDDGKTRAERVVSKLLELCEEGDVKAISLVLERIDGKVTEPVDLTSNGETFRFTVKAPERDRSDD